MAEIRVIFPPNGGVIVTDESIAFDFADHVDGREGQGRKRVYRRWVHHRHHPRCPHSMPNVNSVPSSPSTGIVPRLMASPCAMASFSSIPL